MAITKDIDLCGMGNALVDLQIEISEEALTALDVNKGEMKLVNNEQQSKIIKILSDYKSHKSSGGSSANTIIDFSQFGGKSAYLTSLGNDANGKFYADEFLDLGIILEATKHQTEPTGTCLVLITPDAERTMLTSLGASALLNLKNIRKDIISRSRWIYIEGYTFSQEASTEAVFKTVSFAKRNYTKVSLTFSDVFITSNYRENLSTIVSSADLIFCNENEAMSYTQTEDVNIAFIKLGEQCSNVVMTCGAKGSMIKWKDKFFNIHPYNTNSVDTTGAGDMYAGAFLYGMLYADTIGQAGKLASFASSKIVSQFGARYNGNIDEIKEIIS